MHDTLESSLREVNGKLSDIEGRLLNLERNSLQVKEPAILVESVGALVNFRLYITLCFINNNCDFFSLKHSL